jgi:hypothetical protein
LCIEEKPSDGGMVSKRSRCRKRFQRLSGSTNKAIATVSPQARHLTQSSRLNMVIVPIFNLAKPRADL